MVGHNLKYVIEISLVAQIPGLGRLHVLRSSEARGPQLLSPHGTTTNVYVLQGPRATADEPM